MGDCPSPPPCRTPPTQHTAPAPHHTPLGTTGNTGHMPAGPFRQRAPAYAVLPYDGRHHLAGGPPTTRLARWHQRVACDLPGRRQASTSTLRQRVPLACPVALCLPCCQPHPRRCRLCWAGDCPHTCVPFLHSGACGPAACRSGFVVQTNTLVTVHAVHVAGRVALALRWHMQRSRAGRSRQHMCRQPPPSAHRCAYVQLQASARLPCCCRAAFLHGSKCCMASPLSPSPPCAAAHCLAPTGAPPLWPCLPMAGDAPSTGRDPNSRQLPPTPLASPLKPALQQHQLAGCSQPHACLSAAEYGQRPVTITSAQDAVRLSTRRPGPTSPPAKALWSASGGCTPTAALAHAHHGKPPRAGPHGTMGLQLLHHEPAWYTLPQPRPTPPPCPSVCDDAVFTCHTEVHATAARASRGDAQGTAAQSSPRNKRPHPRAQAQRPRCRLPLNAPFHAPEARCTLFSIPSL
jgi:hypothetical protein